MKPAVSAGAADLYWVKTPEEAEVLYRTHFKNKHETLMIQPFREEIKTEGEWSFIFLNGSYSHGVLKKTLEEGIGVKHSTQNQHYKPTEEMIHQAAEIHQKLLAGRGDNPLYTRLDTLRGADGKLVIMEIEQIEPFLYLHARDPESADQMVEGILEKLMNHFNKGNHNAENHNNN
jgi:hypothetical protein